MLDIGATIGDYRLEERIGRGGMGVVFRATQLSLGRPVALKLITPEFAEDPTFRERFKREARLAAQIDHPNVVPVHQADEQDGHLYIAMRYVPGTDLRAYMGAHGRLDPHDAMRVVEQIAAALDAAHDGGLVHRDVKPGNVLLSGREGSEHVYLTDFGLTKIVGSTGALTRTGGVVGTLDYIAPEQLRGEHVDGRADVYALGCVLYELLTAMVPFARESDVAKLYAHMSEPPPRPSEVVPTLRAGLDGVVRRAMAKDRETRYATAGDLAAAAHAAIAVGASSDAPKPAQAARISPATTIVADAAAQTEVAPPAPLAPFSPPQAPAPSRPRRRLGALVAVCAAGVVAAIIGFATGGPSSSTGGSSSSDAPGAQPGVQAVASICEQSNRVQKARVRRFPGFGRRLKRLRSLGATRDHILDEIQLRLSASTDLRSRLAAAASPPAAKRALHAETLKVWERNLLRLRRHRNALMGVRTFRGLFRVLDRPPRAAIEDDATMIITNLRKLGGTSCDLDPLMPDSVIRVEAGSIATPGATRSRALSPPVSKVATPPPAHAAPEMPPVLPPVSAAPPEESEPPPPPPPALPPPPASDE